MYRLDSGELLLQSVDFITPVVDDPYVFGKIAAANALSDIFAMGGEVKTALNLVMWDKEHVSKEALGEILKGGLEKITESGATLLGGHTIIDREQKYGLSVSGVASAIWRNNTPKVGDVLLLCKPIGSGIVTTALKQGKAEATEARECIESMSLLNLQASRLARKYPISACTDITGFGLIGHLLEMCPVGVSLELEVGSVALFDGVEKWIEQGCISGGSRGNKSYFESHVRRLDSLREDIFLYDAQTSGGIVFALERGKALELLDELRQSGYERASIIGEFVPRRDCAIILG